MKFTLEQKMQAISEHLYCSQGRPPWTPYVDAYYTIIRNDTELYQVVVIDTFRGVVQFKRVDDQHLADCKEHGFENNVQEFDIEGFTTEGFGINRIPVAEHVLGIERSKNAPKREWEA